MRSFADIYQRAAARKGGDAALEALLATTPARSTEKIARLTDDRILSMMSKWVFGTSWHYSLIEGKWPTFEKVFHRFQPRVCVQLSDEAIVAHLKTDGIIHSLAKLRSIPVNAAWVLELSAGHGRAARFFAEWPVDDVVSLIAIVQRNTAAMGGETAARFLRAIGKPAFLPTPDVLGVLVKEGVLDSSKPNRANLGLAQDAINHWARESGRDQTAVSRILSMSVGGAVSPSSRPQRQPQRARSRR